jgi:hypothetical protein
MNYTSLNEQGTYALKPLRKVAGITVNTVSGKASTIAMRRERYGADVESMEGAALYVLLYEAECTLPAVEGRFKLY